MVWMGRKTRSDELPTYTQMNIKTEAPPVVTAMNRDHHDNQFEEHIARIRWNSSTIKHDAHKQNNSQINFA